MVKIDKKKLTENQRREIKNVLSAIKGIPPYRRIEMINKYGYYCFTTEYPIDKECVPMMGKIGNVYLKEKAICLEIGEGKFFWDKILLVKLKDQENYNFLYQTYSPNALRTL